LVTLEGIDTTSPDGPILKLGGIDLIDGTPIYDIKPYLSYAEAITGARAGFAHEEIPRLKVKIEENAENDFKKLPTRAQNLILEALSLDPRPAVQAHQEDRTFGAMLCGKNVRFTIKEKTCRITDMTDATRE
jgi:hypothetical protein